MLGQQNPTELRDVEPFVRGTLYAAEIEVERVNVHVGPHWRVLKKQEPSPEERPRALLANQSGEMMVNLLSNKSAIVKQSLILPIKAIFACC
jgi:hypothetical protein